MRNENYKIKKFKLTQMQETMLFETINSQDTRYVSVLRYNISKDMDVTTLKKRADLLSERHEALRTSFTRDSEGNLWQEAADHADVEVSVADTYTDAEARINPLGGKLFRLILCGKELIVIFHHALLDGWSVGVLMRELLADEAPERKASPFRYYVKWLGQRSHDDDLQWWKNYLDGVDTESRLPGHSGAVGYERRELRFKLDNQELIKKRATQLRVTTGRLIQAVWSMLIARYNSGNCVVYSVNSGRSAPVPKIAEMVGMCVNTLPIAAKLPAPGESLTFDAWISEWSRQAAEAEKHGFCRLSDIVRAPMSHILAIEPDFDGDGYRLISSSARLVTDFDAVFTLRDEINAEFAYNASAYSDEAVAAIKGHFLTAMNAVLDDPHISLENIPILTDEETAKLTAVNEDREILDIISRKTAADFWSEIAAEHGERIALVCGDLELTYADLADQVNRLSVSLAAKGVTAERPVAIRLERSERYVIAELAVIMAGGFFIPLDPEWPENRIQVILGETNPFMVIDEENYAELSAACDTLPPAAAPKPEDAAYIIMTSGTTGIPKGVVITHKNLLGFCLWAKKYYNWLAGDSCAMVIGFGFDGSMWDIWLPLISGGTLHILSDDVRFSISGLGEYCRTNRITHIYLPVTMADSFREVYRGENTLPDLRYMATGGEEVRRVVPAPYPLSNEYGPTECTVCCSTGRISPDDTPITVGSPPLNMHVYIMDAWGRICPDGVVGEAYFSGVQIARGYYNSPELTAARFINNPFANGNRDHNILYRTGDLMYWKRLGANRELVFIGREDNQIKINGYRVELGEIESSLLAHPLITAVTAAVRENGAGEKRIVAYASVQSGSDISKLDEAIAGNLPAFMRPTIILVDHIPLNTSGKVDYSLLPLPETESTARYAAPETENEKALISAVSQVLNVSDIGSLHNYLELGGNSINAMRVAFRLEKEGFELSAREIISSGNFKELASKMRPIASALAGSYPTDAFVPLSAQQAMVFLAETGGSELYTVTIRMNAVGLAGDELKRRLHKAAKLHDILRTKFELDDNGNISGHVHDSYEIPLSIGDAESANGIDPLRDPLLDLTLCGGELIIRYHHIALDGWSVNLLVNEILFDRFPESAPSFAQFANRLAAKEQRRADDEAWWRTHCGHVKIVPLLPPKPDKKTESNRIVACSPELLLKCSDAARKAHVTTAAFMLAAWGIVLCAVGAEDGDILIPFVASSRDNENLMGMCAATYPLVFSNTGELFGALTRNVQDTMIESVRRLFVPQDIIGKLPEYLFVFEGAADCLYANADGEQNYDLVLKFADCGEIIYNANRIPEHRVKFIASRLEAVLNAALDDKISLYYENEYELVTKTFAHGRELDLRHQSLAEAFAEAADYYAGRIALEAEDRTLTYSELYSEVKNLAGKLGELNIGVGDAVAFSLPRKSEGIIAQLGIALSGAAFLPLDPEWPRDRIQDILSDSGAAAVISRGMNIESTGRRGALPKDSAYALYTSGTTGRPKGVVVPQRALANQIAWGIDEFGFNANDRVLHYIAFTFDPSVWVLSTALSAGATLSLMPECLRLDPDAIARYISEHHITVCVFPAAVCTDVMRRVQNHSLRLVFFGGSSPKNLPARTGGLEAVNLYGPTEACINAAFRRMPPMEASTNNIGIPVANTKCYVLDASGNPCPVGIQGELCIGGVQLAHGYLNRIEESASAFTEHPVFGRIYRTGDRAIWNEDGTLEFYGRRDGQIKIRGNRVETGEIEHALCSLPEVSDAKIKPAKDALDAYVIWKECVSPLDIVSLRQSLSLRLPSYMLPRTVTSLKSFPLTENGKVDYAALPDAAAVGLGGRGELLSETERTVAAAWKTALTLDDDFEIGRYDNFFDLGGHSLLLFGVMGLFASSGVRIDIKTLIERPVLAELAAAIDGWEHTSSPKATVRAASDFNFNKYGLYVKEMEQINLAEKRPYGNILITGATGFLGSHLVNEFFKNTQAEIYLPVRDSVKRLEESLAYYFGGRAHEMVASKRLHTYVTDISEDIPHCGAPLNAIIHSAADIRHYAPEPEMYKANVTATENMIELSLRHPNALFAHISTTSAVNAPFIHETDTDTGAAFENIYQRTKQLAEQSVLEAGNHGLRYAIFRVGHVSPGYEKGSVARNWEINAMLRLINAMLLTGLLPEQNYKIGYGYADITARAIMLLSQPLNLERKIFHIDNPHKLRLSELFSLAGLSGEVVQRSELVAGLRGLAASEDGPVRSAALEYLGRLSQGDLEKDSSDIVAGEISLDATLTLLERLGLKWPHVTGEYMHNVIRSLKNKGGTI